MLTIRRKQISAFGPDPAKVVAIPPPATEADAEAASSPDEKAGSGSPHPEPRAAMARRALVPLNIRDKQMGALAAPSCEEFLCRMERHLREHFEPVTGPLRREQLREVIERNWKRAEEYGLESEFGICSYLNFVFTLGELFEEQPAYSWAAKLLNDASMAEQETLERLDAGLQEVLKRI